MIERTAVVSKYVEFDAGHRVPMHASKCSNPHGHRYRVVVHVRGPILEPAGAADDGMVVDFGVLKALLVEHVHDVYDHAFLVWREDYELRKRFDASGWKVVVTDFVPTAECIAEHVFYVLREHLPAPLVLLRVDVHETPTSIASVEAQS